MVDELLYRHALIPRLIIDGDSYKLFFETSEKDTGKEPRRVEASAVIGAWQGGLQLVPVEGGGWAPLPGDWLARAWPSGRRPASGPRAQSRRRGRAATLCDARRSPSLPKAWASRGP